MHVGKTKLENSVSSFKNSSSWWNLSLNSLSSGAGKHLMWTIFLVEPQNLSFRHSSFVSSFSPFLLCSPYSSFSPCASPKDSSHQSKNPNPNPKITILALERLPKLGFIDLGTGAAWVCWSRHRSALGFVDLGTGAHLGLMFLFGIVAWFCCFLGLLSLEVGLGFWELEKLLVMVVWREQGEGENRQGKNGTRVPRRF